MRSDNLAVLDDDFADGDSAQLHFVLSFFLNSPHQPLGKTVTSSNGASNSGLPFSEYGMVGG